MAKRRCVQQPIIELSDSEDDQESHERITTEIKQVTVKSRDARVPQKKTVVSENRRGKQSCKKKIIKHEKSRDQNEQPRDSKFLASPCNSTGKVARGRKRKVAETDGTEMGIFLSSTTTQGDPKKQRKVAEPVDRTEVEKRAKQEDRRQSGIGYSRNYAAARIPEKEGSDRVKRELSENLQNEQKSGILTPTEQKGFQQPLQCPRETPFPTGTFCPKSSLMDVKPRKTKGLTASSVFESLKMETETANGDSRTKDAASTYMACLAESKIRCVEWTEVDYIEETHGIGRHVAENVIKLFKADNTIPFIARYRKNMTQGMDADELRNIKNSWDRAKLVKQKASNLIKEIDKQGKWTPEFHAFVQSTKSLSDLEQIQSVFKLTKSTLVEKARDVGLDIPAQAVMKAEKIEPLYLLTNPKKEGLKTEEQIRDGVVCILADMINKDKSTFEKVQALRSTYSMIIEIKKTKNADKVGEEAKTNKQKDEATKYDLYHNFSMQVNNLKPHQVLAINRGESRKILSVKINIPPQFERDFKAHCLEHYANVCRASPMHDILLKAAFDYLWNKSIKSSIGRRTRHELNEKAEVASMDVFAENVKQLLLTPPLRGKVVLGVDPGFRHGCKMAVISEQGDVLETATMYPHDSNNPRAKNDAARLLSRLVLQHRCTVLALGNGTACRETEVFLAELIKKRTFEPLNVVYTIVDETGASIYSCSREATAEFPDLDANVVSAISIARRLQDPMAELVKIEPKHLGVGMYQHDLPEKELAAKLNEVIMEAVSFVGVDINTASVSLLKRVAGLGDSRANHIIDWRRSSGPFRTRSELLKVPRIGNKTFEQCAGFIRILPETAVSDESRPKRDPFNYLDQTWIHPESYDTAKAFVAAAKCNPDQLGTKNFISAVKSFAEQGYSALAQKFNTTVETIKIIVEGLSMEKGQDIRAKADESMFRESMTSFDDLAVGRLLTGVVRNKTDFGAFVDVGVERSGLIHRSKMGGITLTVGQRVETQVQSIEKERGRLGLILVRCL